MSALAEIRRIVTEELREGRQLQRDDHHIASLIADRLADMVPDDSTVLCSDCARELRS